MKGLVFYSMFFVAMLSYNEGVAYPTADYLQFPLKNYEVNSNNFGAYNIVGNYRWHLGEDAKASVGDDVYPIGKGIVKFVGNIGSQTKGYGGTVITEHNTGTEIVTFISGHMDFTTIKVKVGDIVYENMLIGKIGSTSVNGGWPVHFHGGLHKRAYIDGSYYYIYDDSQDKWRWTWAYLGYTQNANLSEKVGLPWDVTHQNMLNDWYDPTNFITSHQSTTNLVGKYPNSSVCQPILNYYTAHGGESVFGHPFDNNSGTAYVHEWPKPEDRQSGNEPYVIIQDFSGGIYGTDKQCAIIYNPAADQAYLLKEGFWGLYKPDQFVMPGGHNTLIDFFGPHHLGAPRSDEHIYSGNENIIVQEFELGYLYYYKEADLFRIKFKTDHAPSGSNLVGNKSYCIVPSWSQKSADLGQGSLISKTLIDELGINISDNQLVNLGKEKSNRNHALTTKPPIRIDWRITSPPENGKIELAYSTDNRVTFQTIAMLNAGLNYYDWTPPFELGTSYWIKIGVYDQYGTQVEFRLSDEYIYGQGVGPEQPVFLLTTNNINVNEPVYHFTKPNLSVQITNEVVTGQNVMEIQAIAKSHNYPDITWYLWRNDNNGICVFAGNETKSFSAQSSGFVAAPAGHEYQITIRAMDENFQWYDIGFSNFTVAQIPQTNDNLNVLGIEVWPQPVYQFSTPECFLSLRNDSSNAIEITQVSVIAQSLENENWMTRAWLYDYNGNPNECHIVESNQTWDLRGYFQRDFFQPPGTTFRLTAFVMGLRYNPVIDSYYSETIELQTSAEYTFVIQNDPTPVPEPSNTPVATNTVVLTNTVKPTEIFTNTPTNTTVDIVINTPTATPTATATAVKNTATPREDIYTPTRIIEPEIKQPNNTPTNTVSPSNTRPWTNPNPTDTPTFTFTPSSDNTEQTSPSNTPVDAPIFTSTPKSTAYVEVEPTMTFTPTLFFTAEPTRANNITPTSVNTPIVSPGAPIPKIMFNGEECILSNKIVYLPDVQEGRSFYVSIIIPVLSDDNILVYIFQNNRLNIKRYGGGYVVNTAYGINFLLDTVVSGRHFFTVRAINNATSLYYDFIVYYNVLPQPVLIDTPTETFTPTPTKNIVNDFVPILTKIATPTMTVLPTPTEIFIPSPVPTEHINIPIHLQSVEVDIGQANAWSNEDEILLKWNSRHGLDKTVDNWHIYFSKNGGAKVFLGQTGKGDVDWFVWNEQAYWQYNFVAAAFRTGPEYGESYRFFIYGLSYLNNSWQQTGVVLQTNPVLHFYTDSVRALGFVDNDNERAIVVSWIYYAAENTRLTEWWHMYVSANGGDFKYLGKASTNKFLFEWRRYFNGPREFQDGPQPGVRYRFKVFSVLPLGQEPRVYELGKCGDEVLFGSWQTLTPTMTMTPAMPKQTATPTPTTAPTPTPTFAPFDFFVDEGKVKGEAKIVNINGQEYFAIVVRWNLPQVDTQKIFGWEVVQLTAYNDFVIGQIKNPDANLFVWSDFTIPKQEMNTHALPPKQGKFYRLRLYALSGDADGPDKESFAVEPNYIGLIQ